MLKIEVLHENSVEDCVILLLFIVVVSLDLYRMVWWFKTIDCYSCSYYVHVHVFHYNLLFITHVSLAFILWSKQHFYGLLCINYIFIGKDSFMEPTHQNHPCGKNRNWASAESRLFWVYPAKKLIVKQITYRLTIGWESTVIFLMGL